MARMTSRTRATMGRVVAPLGATAALLGTITGCSAAAPEAPAEVVDASYRDGEYQANGPYQSPNGSENIIVAIELENDIVIDVDITVNPNNPTTAN